MKSTIHDVSRLSGVSTATVSRAFSSPEQVRESTRRKVYEAASALNYTPNAIARDMALQRTNRIAYLICKQRATILDEFYAGICEGIMKRANALNLQLIVSTADDWQKMAANAQSKQIEGVILGGDAAPELIADFRARHVAIALVNNRVTGADLPCVLADERDGIGQAVDHLVSLGHTRIAMLLGRFSPYIVGERYAGFLEAMGKHGIRVGASDIAMCERDIQSATEAAVRMLSRPYRPTAVVGGNDVIAAGVLKAARRLCISIPGELSITGYDNSSICDMLEPGLSSVWVDVQQMGETSVDLLRAVMEQEQDAPRVTVIPTRLIKRGTCQEVIQYAY